MIEDVTKPGDLDLAQHLNALREGLRATLAQREAMAASWHATARQMPQSGDHYRRLAVEEEASAGTLARQVAALERLMQLTGTLHPGPRSNGTARLLTQSFKIAAEASGFNAAFYLQVDRLPADLAPVGVQFKTPGKFGETGIERLLQLQNAALRLALSPQAAAEHLAQEARSGAAATGTEEGRESNQEARSPAGATGREA